VSDPQKKKELSSEMRILLASVLSMLVIFGWAKFLGPKLQPAQNPPATATQPAPQSPASTGYSPAPIVPSGSTAAAGKGPTALKEPLAQTAPVKTDTQERPIVVENDFYRVEFSNRGAVVKSWQLKRYKDDSKPQRILDVVHPEAAEQTGGWPFSLAMPDANFERAANSVLYSVTPAEGPLRAPTEVKFEYSDGHFVVTKTFHFDHSYTVTVDTAVAFDNIPLPHAIAWRGGFGDLTVHDPIPVEQVSILYSTGGKVQLLPHKKLDLLAPGGTAPRTSGNDYAGIEDRYFAAVFLPAGGAPPASVTAQYWKLEHAIQVEGKTAQEPVPEMAAGSTTIRQPGETAAGSGLFPPLSLRVYVGPKDYDDLKKMNPPLQALVEFGWLEIVAAPLFQSLKWLYKYIPNWGWAIIILTLVINMLLFPLRISSYRTAQKMQRIAPQVKQIQERYKKYSMRDPKKAEMNKEVMDLYKREGINPVGGCVPMLLQMPIWFGLNQAIRFAIELRHAPWINGWIADLSAKDPYYVLPVGVGASMYFVSKMTPMATADPSQQRMMKFMPIMMAGMFIVFPLSSGLALYILTSSVVGIGQQWYLNKTHPAPAPVKASRGKK
jgi:YidC/Oxa1 family membrane protein insertase